MSDAMSCVNKRQPLKKIPISEPFVQPEDIRLVAKALEEKQVSGRAPIVREFEIKFAEYIGAKYAIACCNGTAALHLAVRAIGVRARDQVITPAFTMMSPVFAVLYQGAKPVLADVDRDFWTLDARYVERRITRKTKTILVVHTYGNPASMDTIREIARRHDLHVIEDCAESLGATYKGRITGTFGDMSAFSFFSNKLITCGEGGMVCTNDEELADRLRSLRDLCFGRRNKFLHEGLGHNYRISALQAALGLSQLSRIHSHLDRVRKIAATYSENLANVEGLQLHREPPDSVGSFWMYSIVLEQNRLSRDRVIAELSKRGIETRPFFVPVHRQPFWPSHLRDENYPASEFLSRRGVNLPSGLSLTDEEIQYVCDNLKVIIDG